MKFHLGHLLGLSAVVLAISAAFFSVTGLGQLFAGASLAVIIMASALEFSKIIIATFLHKYWQDLSKILKTYLTVGLVILVAITSAGIYGFLSSAYQTTATQLEAHEGQVGLIDNKILLVEGKIQSNTQVVNSKLERYNNLMELRSIQETRLDSMINRRYFSNAESTRNEIAKASTEMERLQGDIDVVNAENSKLKDSIGKFQLNIMEMKASSTVAGEVGPLKYMAELTGQSMDVIVNYFTLLLIFVFDPLAISLVIATNWVFERKRREKEEKDLERATKGSEDENKEPVIPEETEDEGATKGPEEEPITNGKWVYVDGDEVTIPINEPVTSEEDNSRWKLFGPIKKNEEAAFIPWPIHNEEVEEPDYVEEDVEDWSDYNVQLEEDTPVEEEEIDINDIEVIEPEEVVVETPAVEVKPEPVKRGISLEDLEKIGPYSKGDRGFSTPIPEPKFSSETRIGTNKILKDGHQAVYKSNKKNED